MENRSAMAAMNPSLSAANQLKATLTNNPQDSTEIPSLFQTFGAHDASSGEDEDVEVIEVHTAHDYSSSAAASAGRGAAAEYGSAARGGAAGPYAAAPFSATRTTGATASLNASRNRHPLNRSTHNPYVLLSSTDGTTLYGPESSAMQTAASSVTGRLPQRYSFSNSTSQNPLTFEFNASATAGDGNGNINSPGATGAGMRRPPSQLLHSLQQSPAQQQQQQSMGEPTDGYWRDGNPMSMSSTDVRPVATTTVGTLSSSTAAGDAQTINVNVRQRVRTSTGSRTSSLSTSQITLPVVQSVPLSPANLISPAAGNANASATTPTYASGQLPRPSSMTQPEGSSPRSQASSEGMRRATSSSCSSNDRRPAQSSNATGPLSAANSSSNNNSAAAINNRNRMVAVPSSAVAGPNDSERRPSQSAMGYGPEAQQQQQYGQYAPHALPLAPQQQHQQQQPYYDYRGPHMPPQPPQQQSPYHHSPTGYADQPYPAMSQQGIPYAMPQQQQYYDPHTGQPHQQQQQQQQGMPMMPSPHAGGYMNPYGQMAPNPNYYMSGAPTMMPGYGYPAMPGMPPHAPPMQHAGYADARGRRGSAARGSSHQPQQQQQYQAHAGVSTSPAAEAPAPSPSAPPTNSAPTSGNAKGKNTNANKGKSTQQPQQQQQQQQGKQAGARKYPTPTSFSPHGKESTTPSSPASGSPVKASSKSQKRPDEARFHADRSAPVQLFVVVKRKMEGQRYACAMAAEEVPIGSHMLVEGDRGADLGEVLAHVSVEQMAHDCAVVERRRKAALEKLQEQKSAAAAAGAGAGATAAEGETATDAESAAAAAANDDQKEKDEEAEVPQLTGQAARDYVLALRDWPRLIGPATPDDVESLGPQREAEQQAFTTARPIVQQFIENRYQQRVARNALALRVSGGGGDGADAGEEAADAASPADASSEDGERHASLTPLTEEELRTLELSRQVTLVDCEYQFTREKITLFVSRPARSIFVDFRRMQRKLYRTFRCRIWIAYMDEIADDEDAPESFVFVPPPSSTAAAAPAAPAADDEASSK